MKATAVPTRQRKSVLHSLAGAASIIRAGGRRIADGDGDLAQLAALYALRAEIDAAVDTAARHLLADAEASRREIGSALGMTPQAVGKRWPGVSARPRGGQEARLR
jgi:hypothetical protein